MDVRTEQAYQERSVFEFLQARERLPPAKFRSLFNIVRKIHRYESRGGIISFDARGYCASMASVGRAVFWLRRLISPQLLSGFARGTA